MAKDKNAQPAITQTPPMRATAPKIPPPLRAKMQMPPLNGSVPGVKNAAAVF